MIVLKTLSVCAVLLGVFAVDVFGNCTFDDSDAARCTDKNVEEKECLSMRVGLYKNISCCFRKVENFPKLNCFADGRMIRKELGLENNDNNRRNFGRRNADDKAKAHFDNLNQMPDKPSDTAGLIKMAKGIDLNAKELGDPKKQDRRSFNPLLFAGLGNLPGLSLFGASAFPKCPVDVKFCYRVPCGGYNNNVLEANPKKCLSDPRCCYDYKLAYMKAIFGPDYMGGTPACYYGATSKQWVYITKHFRPWNAYYTEFILKAFKGLFKTNAFSIGGKYVCDIDFRKKAYPVGAKSELQCNLVSGCWDEDLPEGSQCLMASELIQSLFGQKEVYPSLFTDDPADTTCSANWLQYGTKAYKRMPCGVGPPPPKIFDMMFDWCPPQECCLNYGAISTKERYFLKLILDQQSGGSSFPSMGSHGFPLGLPGIPGLSNLFGPKPLGHGHQTPFDSSIFLYLFSSSGEDYLDLFCPYKPYFTSGLLYDFSEETEGCCEIPKCYHKKKLVGQPRYRPYPPTPKPKPTVYATWGPWQECKAECGRQGRKYRECYVGHEARPGLCSGPASQYCTGKPCPPPPVRYHWGDWSESGPCSQTCGEGYVVYSRSCYKYQHGHKTEVNPSHCNGQAQKYEGCNAGPCGPEYHWGHSYEVLQPCSATCGQGYEVWGRKCLTKSGQVVDSRHCPGRQDMQNRGCKKMDCPEPARWGPWEPASACGATCGSKGLQLERRECITVSGKPAHGCHGEDERVVPCKAPECPTEYYWVGWIKEPCRREHGGYCRTQQQRKQHMLCYESVHGTYRKVEPQSRCGPPRVRYIPCNPQECMKEGY